MELIAGVDESVFIRAVRAYLGLTVPQAAHLLNIKPRTLQRLENGSMTVPEGVMSELVELSHRMESLADNYIADGHVSLGELTALELRAVGQALRDSPELRVTQ